jgi:predicted CopG family antitoxin
MSKKLTITVDDEIYQGLHSVIGRRRISRFLNDLARPHVLRRDLAEGYLAMAADTAREPAAAEWVENLTPAVSPERQLT